VRCAFALFLLFSSVFWRDISSLAAIKIATPLSVLLALAAPTPAPPNPGRTCTKYSMASDPSSGLLMRSFNPLMMDGAVLGIIIFVLSRIRPKPLVPATPSTVTMPDCADGTTKSKLRGERKHGGSDRPNRTPHDIPQTPRRFSVITGTVTHDGDESTGLRTYPDRHSADDLL
jgi:hypothetical protein